jgi:putative phage-type endonuclease
MQYKIIELTQGTSQWLEWRKSHITSSDIPCLFDESPYKTAKELFEEKIGIGQEKPKSQWLMDKGHRAESICREWLSKEYKNEFKPVVVESLECPDLGASLDGLSNDLGLIAEFKYIGKKAVDDVKNTVLKKSHSIQVQAQLAATGIKKCVYFATDLTNSAYLEIERDELLIKEIFEKSKAFMAEVREFS